MKKIISCICCLVMLFSTVSVYAADFEEVRGDMSMSYGMGRYVYDNEVLKGYCQKTGYNDFEYGYIVEYTGGFGGGGADASVYVDNATNYDKLVFDARIISDEFCSISQLYDLFGTPDNASYITKYSDIKIGKVSLYNTSNDTMPSVEFTENWGHYEIDISDLDYFGVYIDALGAKQDNNEVSAVIVTNLKMIKSNNIVDEEVENNNEGDYYIQTEPSEWAKESIVKANELGLWTDGSNYQVAIKREDFATLIVEAVVKAKGTDTHNELENLPHDKFVHFEDTSSGHIILAHAMGIVNGVGDNKFAPEQKITRQEIAVMIHRAINYIEKEKGVDIVVDNTNLQSFIDASAVADWATTAVGTLANNGVMKGTSETTLSPLDNTTIEQAIVLVLRVFEIVK